MLIAVVCLSLLVQLVAVGYTLRLVAVTGWKSAWALLALGIVAMGIRRAISFFDLVAGWELLPYKLPYELIGLAGSGLMLAGIFLIKPIVLSYITAEREQRLLASRLQEALSQVKTLTGMLPICASCKKIRNDTGYWEGLEHYISSHSEAEFSHGICPDCIKELYPELYEERKLENKKLLLGPDGRSFPQ